MIRLSRWLALAVVAVVVPASSLFAAPTDSKVGDVRVTFAKAGTPIRADANALAAPVGAPLPAGTSVTLLEVKLPWIKVRTASNPPVEGWLKAYETVEPSALAGTPPPPHLTGVPPGTVTQQQVSAAGRQFSENTERGYRVSRRDLELGYRYVDRMEADTAALDMFEMISFVVDGNLGRRGRAYDRPARLPPSPRSRASPSTSARSPTSSTRWTTCRARSASSSAARSPRCPATRRRRSGSPAPPRRPSAPSRR